MELTLNGGLNSRDSLHKCHMNENKIKNKKKKEKRRISKFNCLVINIRITLVCNGLISMKNVKNHIFTPQC
jgi:hypothetical protein